jgi:hypothetical protein
MNSEEKIPSGLELTYKMLKCAFPEGIEEKLYFAVLMVLRINDMPFRRIAEALPLITRKDFSLVYNDAVYVETENLANQTDIDYVIELLKPCGYSDWQDE